MITELRLKNFRCFEDFSVEGLRPVTLIAGANSVGKTALLESIYLFCETGISVGLLRLRALRGYQIGKVSPKTLWEPLFTNADITREILIGIKNQDNLNAITLKKDSSRKVPYMAPLEGLSLKEIPVEAPLEDNYPLEIVYFENGKTMGMETLSVIKQTISQNGDLRIDNKVPNVHYLYSARVIPVAKTSELLGKLDVTKQKPKVLEILRMFDPRIQDVSSIALGEGVSIFADIGLPSLQPINTLGDGVNKLMLIALLMLANPGAVILIDEVENGFHYSFFPKLWEIIGKLATETNCQVIATSHSYECIQGALGLATDTEKPDLFRFIRLDKVNGKPVAKVFDNDSFENLIENDWEVR
jgi:predicted ATPase